MPRHRLVRLQLGLLAALVLLLVGRALVGGERVDAEIALTSLDPNELHHAAFTVETPTTVVLEGAGSLERADAGAPVAAYGWITRRDTREAVWTMTAGGERRGTLFHAADTITLEPGTYDAYFAGYGADLASNRHGSLLRRIVDPAQRWRGDHDEWRLLVRSVDGGRHLRRLGGEAARPALADRPGLVWASGPVRDRKRVDHTFEVVRPTELHVYAVGEIGREANDYGWIEAAATGEPVWTFGDEPGEPAGGAEVNRRVRTTLRLAPGLYRAAYRADRGHAFSDWMANPPHDPYGWGLTLTAEDEGAVRPFDPFAAREPILALTRVSDDHLVSAQFVVERPLEVIVHAMGEIVGSTAYDYAWITNNATEQRVWEMDPDRTRLAGGASKNRIEEAFLTLDPGTYTLYYQTDGSHAYGDWNEDAPEHPERWGAALFPVAPRLPDGAVRVLHQRREWGGEVEAPADAPLPPAPAAPGAILVDRTGLGNDAHERVAFSLDEPTRIRIRAVGEINRGGRYDWGGIERADTGETVWEMTWQNTTPAGGADRNRRYDGTVLLEPGGYVAYFRTDPSHAYGSFDGDAPHHPAAWGVRIEQVDR